MKMKQTVGQQKIALPGDQPRPGTKEWVTLELSQPTRTCQQTAHLTTCPTCHALTLYGYTDDIASWPTRADLNNLDYTTQIILATAGRPLYQLTTNQAGTAYKLYYATGPNHALTVLTNHRCGYPPPGGQSILTPPTTHYPPGTPAPF